MSDESEKVVEPKDKRRWYQYRFGSLTIAIGITLLNSCTPSDKTITLVTPQQYLEHRMRNSSSPKKMSSWEIQKEDDQYVYYGEKSNYDGSFRKVHKCKKSDLLTQLPCYKIIDGTMLGNMLVNNKEFSIGKDSDSNPYLKGGYIKNDTNWDYKIEEKFILITYTLKSSDDLGNRTVRIVNIEVDKNDPEIKKYKVVRDH